MRAKIVAILVVFLLAVAAVGLWSRSRKPAATTKPPAPTLVANVQTPNGSGPAYFVVSVYSDGSGKQTLPASKDWPAGSFAANGLKAATAAFADLGQVPVAAGCKSNVGLTVKVGEKTSPDLTCVNVGQDDQTQELARQVWQVQFIVAGAQVYEDKADGFSFKYPAGWKQLGGSGGKATFSNENVTAPGTGSPNAIFLALSDKDGLSQADCTAAPAGEAVLLTHDEPSVFGDQSHKTVTQSGSKYRSRWSFYKADEKSCYAMDFTANTQAAFNQQAAAIISIFASWHFTK